MLQRILTVVAAHLGKPIENRAVGGSAAQNVVSSAVCFRIPTWQRGSRCSGD
jgi:hypothetical protein